MSFGESGPPRFDVNWGGRPPEMGRGIYSPAEKARNPRKTGLTPGFPRRCHMRPWLEVFVSTLPPSNGITANLPSNGRGRVSRLVGRISPFRPLFRADRGDGTTAELTLTECRRRGRKRPVFHGETALRGRKLRRGSRGRDSK